MTRLHSIVVVPAAVVVLASATHGASPRACKPVVLPTSWAAACEPATDHAGDQHPHAVALELAVSPPLAGLAPAEEAAAPGETRAAPAAAAGEAAAGGAVAASARGPPAGAA